MRAKKTQAIAHRGYKAIYPENTMLSFKGAVEAGAHAIETDLHLTRDGVVVISHDATLKRCFGVDRKIIDCDWEEIKTLRTLKEPGQPMPTLREVVEYLATSELEAKGVWLLLDIKIDSPADDIMRLTAETISKVHEGTEYWGGRIVLGCWTLKYLPVSERIHHIGYSIPYAQQFLDHQDVGVNMFWPVMQTAAGKAFLEELKDAGRSVFVWNINNDAGMKWAIANEYIDGVCTDDPVKFLKYVTPDNI
ncbi:PLC-like phosphodiesterase [Sphaerosporella brunnea]|uniref:PLC-like phosphodiesterase n=1 Tax=Sphaerosporella brunnea TaxID=1250544 RepID=A0A5J5EZK1_9PEZI|nr:PLC-like phosphodiesterase [Sphaerosporella brunnea]